MISETTIPPTMRSIIGMLLLGLAAVVCNFALFLFLLFMALKTGLSFQENISYLFEHYVVWTSVILTLEVLLFTLWPTLFCYLVYKHDRALIPLIKQFAIGWCVMMIFIGIVTLLILLALYHDGKLGEVAAFIMGLMTSPFTMELILGSIGIFLIIALNILRAKLQGDDYVEMVIETPEEKQ